jgi:hypothetical protein
MRRYILIPLFFCLLSLSTVAQETDTLIIFDFSSQNQLARRTGKYPLLLHFNDRDTLSLDADSKDGRKLDNHFLSDATIPNGLCRVIGVRIIFAKNTPYCLRVTGRDAFRKKQFYVDTNFCVNRETPRPFIFWNVLRQEKNVYLSFTPTSFTLSNEEFRNKRSDKQKRIKHFFAALRYEYNALTGVLKKIS